MVFTSVDSIAKHWRFLKLHCSTVPSSVAKLVLTFLHSDCRSKLNAIHHINVPLADLNLSVVELVADFITAMSATEAVYGTGER